MPKRLDGLLALLRCHHQSAEIQLRLRRGWQQTATSPYIASGEGCSAGTDYRRPGRYRSDRIGGCGGLRRRGRSRGYRSLWIGVQRRSDTRVLTLTYNPTGVRAALGLPLVELLVCELALTIK